MREFIVKSRRAIWMTLSARDIPVYGCGTMAFIRMAPGYTAKNKQEFLLSPRLHKIEN